MPDIIELKFERSKPLLVLRPATPEVIDVEFAAAVVGKDGITPDADDLDGFATSPVFYYLLASQ